MQCAREFPQLVQLHRKLADKVACMSVNIDFNGAKGTSPESSRDRVQEFLQERGATFQNVISSDPDEVLYKKLDLASVPAVLVYDRQGKLNKRFDNDREEYGEEGFSYQRHVIPLVEKLLAEPL